MNILYLSRRNLQTLLNKLDRKDSAKGIIKNDTVHPKYPITEPTMVLAIEDEDYYIDREPGYVVSEDEPKTDLASVETKRLRAAIKHIHWSMGDELIHSDDARDHICPLCDDALKTGREVDILQRLRWSHTEGCGCTRNEIERLTTEVKALKRFRGRVTLELCGGDGCPGCLGCSSIPEIDGPQECVQEADDDLIETVKSRIADPKNIEVDIDDL